MIQRSHQNNIVRQQEHGRTQRMLEQVMHDTLTENICVVGRDRTHCRELFRRLRDMGATTRDGETLRANGHTIEVVTPSRVVPGYEPGTWRRQASNAKVVIDHAALELM